MSSRCSLKRHSFCPESTEVYCLRNISGNLAIFAAIRTRGGR